MNKRIRLTSYGTVELGSLIDALEAVKADAHFTWDFLGMHVGLEVRSYRGYYDHLAIPAIFTYPWPGACTPGQLVVVLKDAIGKTFEGYKGGDYVMNEATPVWAANYGSSSSTGIVDVIDYGWHVILETRYVGDGED